MSRHLAVIAPSFSPLNLHGVPVPSSSSTSLASTETRPWWQPLACTAALAIAALLVFSAAVFKHLDHDEHQFIASAVLLLRQHLNPYESYPYFHAPYLVWIYAALFSLTNHLLLAARAFSAACGLLILVLLAVATAARLGSYPPRIRLLLAFAIPAFLLTNPLFTYTSGRAWNHDLPTLLTLASFLLISPRHAAPRSPLARSLTPLAAGLLAGVSVGVRLTFALPAIVLLAMAFLTDPAPRDRLTPGLCFLGGLVLSLLPFAFVLFLVPEQCIFGNVSYAWLNTSFRIHHDYPKGLFWLGKIKFLFTDVLAQPSNAAAAAVAIASTRFTLRRSTPLPRACHFNGKHLASFHNRSTPRPALRVLWLLLVLVSLLLAAAAPSPAFYPYYYTPLVFTLLLIVAAAPPYEYAAARFWRRAVLVAAVISIGFGAYSYRYVFQIAHVSQWVTTVVHRDGITVARAAAGRPVLTLEPIFPLEGGATIYPEFATGAFAFRIEPQLTHSQEIRMQVLGADDLVGLTRRQPPGAILYGSEGAIETPIVKLAQKSSRQCLALPQEKPLWLAAPLK